MPRLRHADIACRRGASPKNGPPARATSAFPCKSRLRRNSSASYRSSWLRCMTRCCRSSGCSCSRPPSGRGLRRGRRSSRPSTPCGLSACSLFPLHLESALQPMPSRLRTLRCAQNDRADSTKSLSSHPGLLPMKRLADDSRPGPNARGGWAARVDRPLKTSHLPPPSPASENRAVKRLPRPRLDAINGRGTSQEPKCAGSRIL